MTYSEKEITRFWAKVIKGSQNECWGWIGATSKGYGAMASDYKTRKVLRAHRMSFELARGKITNGLHVLHKCDNPTCSNPEHLFLGTHADNMRDMFAKKRRVSATGERVGSSKLTRNQVGEIRASTDLHKVLAEKYGVSESRISSIKHFRDWK